MWLQILVEIFAAVISILQNNHVLRVERRAGIVQRIQMRRAGVAYVPLGTTVRVIEGSTVVRSVPTVPARLSWYSRPLNSGNCPCTATGGCRCQPAGMCPQCCYTQNPQLALPVIKAAPAATMPQAAPGSKVTVTMLQPEYKQVCTPFGCKLVRTGRLLPMTVEYTEMPSPKTP